jgi:hypothetical protein
MSHPGCDVMLRDINKLTAEDLALKTEVKGIFTKYKKNLKTENDRTTLV